MCIQIAQKFLAPFGGGYQANHSIRCLFLLYVRVWSYNDYIAVDGTIRNADRWICHHVCIWLLNFLLCDTWIQPVKAKATECAPIKRVPILYLWWWMHGALLNWMTGSLSPFEWSFIQLLIMNNNMCKCVLMCTIFSTYLDTIIVEILFVGNYCYYIKI